MTAMRALGIYREAEFSPGKVEADAAILDGVLAELCEAGFETRTLDACQLDADPLPATDLVLAMCQSARALERLALLEESGAVAVNSALAIRNCYRDLLGVGLARAGVPTARGVLIDTSAPPHTWRLDGLDPARGLYVKRGNLHALTADDVQHVDGSGELEAALASFARRGVRQAYVQQAVAGQMIKFYGVSGGEYFAALPEQGQLPDSAERKLRQAAERAATALGLQVWGGDAILDGMDVALVDFNDWPSFSRVRREAARAIGRRCILLLRRSHHNK